KGAAAKADNYQGWTITKRGLGIYFDPYQVGPYAAGPQFVLVPYSDLKDLINPDGPVGQFAK
ncbi:MAG TPA: RsiV family protein, partial [Pyrinomonadaceae bacterium]|nr:RsiV family protein [Pyrinomonadaceae bacterium]